MAMVTFAESIWAFLHRADQVLNQLAFAESLGTGIDNLNSQANPGIRV